MGRDEDLGTDARAAGAHTRTGLAEIGGGGNYPRAGSTLGRTANGDAPPWRRDMNPEAPPPVGRVCVPRAMGWLPDYPDFRDYTVQTDRVEDRFKRLN